ncbi:MAG: RNA polymerase sigma factor [Planctomycetota bacterium]
MKEAWDGERDPLAALRGGRSGPFEAFVEAEARTFLSYFARLGATRSEAEDLTQETFLKLYSSSAHRTAQTAPDGSLRYESRGQFSGFAFRVARNVWIDRVRKRAGERAILESDGPQGMADQREDTAAPHPEAGAIRRESSERIRRAVSALPASHREVFELAVVEELPYSAISEALDIPVGTVKSRMHNAVRRVRASLEESDRVREAVRDREASRASGGGDR